VIRIRRFNASSLWGTRVFSLGTLLFGWRKAHSKLHNSQQISTLGH
jgi:hypothetical protein